MAKLIDADNLLEQIDKYMDMTLYGCTFRGGKIPPMMLEMRQAVLCDVEQLIYSTPTIDAAPVRRGEWVKVDEYCNHAKEYKCTACEMSVDLDHYTRWCDYNFCPNCGADMRGEEDHEPED